MRVLRNPFCDKNYFYKKKKQIIYQKKDTKKDRF